MMAILVKGNDVRSGRKAKVRHGTNIINVLNYNIPL